MGCGAHPTSGLKFKNHHIFFKIIQSRKNKHKLPVKLLPDKEGDLNFYFFFFLKKGSLFTSEQGELTEAERRSKQKKVTKPFSAPQGGFYITEHAMYDPAEDDCPC